MRAANDNDTEEIDDFLSEYLDVLYPILLQGQIYDLNSDMQAIVKRHGIKQAAIEAIHSAVLESSLKKEWRVKKNADAVSMLYSPHVATIRRMRINTTTIICYRESRRNAL